MNILRFYSVNTMSRNFSSQTVFSYYDVKHLYYDVYRNYHRLTIRMINKATCHNRVRRLGDNLQDDNHHRRRHDTTSDKSKASNHPETGHQQPPRLLKLLLVVEGKGASWKVVWGNDYSVSWCHLLINLSPGQPGKYSCPPFYI